MRSEKCRALPAGFTLLEILVVLFIISVALLAALPNFLQLADEPLRREAMRLSSLFRYTNDTAVARKESRELVLHLERNTWTSIGPEEKEDDAGRLASSVVFEDVIDPSDGKTTKGDVRFRFTPAGLSKPAVIHLARDDGRFSIILHPYTALVETKEGYVE